MTKREKRLEKLLAGKELSFKEVNIILGDFGYRLVRAKGSHFIFMKHGKDPLIIPRHNNKVKKIYITQIIKRLNEE